MSPIPGSRQSPLLSHYDALLVLDLTSHSSLATPDHYASAVRDVASKAQKGLLIYLPATPLWHHLARDRPKSFDAVQTFLSRVYILATVALKEDDACDVVLQVLRGTNEEDLLLDLNDLQPESLKQLFKHVQVVNDADAPSEVETPKNAEESQGEETQEASTDHELGTVALGGTFDHLHAGHKILLTMACWIAQRRVIAGITDDILLKNKSDRDLLESIEQRTKATKSFLDLVCPHIQHDLPALQDVYGPTASDPDVQGIIVSEESRNGATSIAKLRKERNLSSLRLFVINVISPDQVIDMSALSKEDMLKAKMGSTQIRRRLRQRMQGESAKP